MKRYAIAILTALTALLCVGVSAAPALATSPTLLATHSVTTVGGESGFTISSLAQTYSTLVIQGQAKSTVTSTCNFYPLVQAQMGGSGSLDQNGDYNDTFFMFGSSGSYQNHHGQTVGTIGIGTTDNTSTGCYNTNDWGVFEVTCPGYSLTTDQICTWHSGASNNTDYSNINELLSAVGSFQWHPSAGTAPSAISQVRFVMSVGNFEVGSYVQIYGE